MIVLGFDTATPATVVGLTLADGTTLEARDDPQGEQRPGHATRLLGLAHGLLIETGVRWGELERIVVGVGPGTFTGLRIGIATARGLAQSLEVALVGVSSLRVLAHGVIDRCVDEARTAEPGEREDGARGTTGGGRGVGVLAVIDARRGEAFVAGYDGEVELIAPHALAPDGMGETIERVAADASLQRWTAVGDGAVRYRETLERLGVLVPDASSQLHLIRGPAICLLGERARAGDPRVVPDYRRRPDAEVALEGAAA
jgi:tRNA threonylcarbamoyladenosine biosynthesis protein TsaB